MITKSSDQPPQGGNEEEAPAQAQPPSPPVIAMTDAADGPEQPKIPDVLPILPIRGVVVFPGTVVPLTLGRPAALKLVDESLPHSKIIGLVTQRHEEVERPKHDDLFDVGVACTVLKLMRQPDGTMVLLIQAIRRFRLGEIEQTEPFIRARVEVLSLHTPASDDKEVQAAFNNLRESAVTLLDLSPEIPEQARLVLANIDDAGPSDRPAGGQPRPGRGAQAGAAGGNRRFQTHADGAGSRQPPDRDRGIAAEAAQGRGIAVFRHPAARVPARANPRHPARTGRGGTGLRGSGGTASASGSRTLRLRKA